MPQNITVIMNNLLKHVHLLTKKKHHNVQGTKTVVKLEKSSPQGTAPIVVLVSNLTISY